MKKFIIPISLLLTGLFLLHSGLSSNADSSILKNQNPPPASSGNEEKLEATDPEFSEHLVSPLPPLPEEEIHTHTIRPGDTASRILSPWLTPAQIHELSRTCKPVFDLRKLRTGRDYQVITENGTFSSFEYTVDATRVLRIDADEEGFQANIHAIRHDIEIAHLHGSIRSSLSEAMKTPEDMVLAVKLGNIFGWEIDFLRDLRQGDTFSVLVEKRFHHGAFQGYGNILAAEFHVQGKCFDAYRFENSDGSADYYTASGENLNRMFLKSPVAFARITSGFSLRRYHPVLKKYLPHYGVDYAAPVGTPIYAAGDGTLVLAAKNASSGRYIRIQHGNGYETAYLHMSGFARGMRTGRKVKQGEVIGYVGQSGFATGPHVCFRMRKDGQPVDPTGIEAPKANPLHEDRRQEFAALVASLQPRLDIRYAKTSGSQKEKPEERKKGAL